MRAEMGAAEQFMSKNKAESYASQGKLNAIMAQRKGGVMAKGKARTFGQDLMRGEHVVGGGYGTL
jgi:hypothetical protein